MKIFIAGPLFSEAELEFNRKVDQRLRDRGFKTFLPQREAGRVWDRAKRGDRRIYRKVYEEDLKGLEKADVIVAILDGTDVDSGTAFEIGYATARGKQVIGLKTDKRMFAEDLELNNMLAQSVHTVMKSIDDLVTELEKYVKGVEGIR